MSYEPSRFHKYSTMRRWYRLHDFDETIRQREGMQEIVIREVNNWNRLGYGIHFENNLFEGPRRNANLKQVLSWAVELDRGTKKEQTDFLLKFLHPSAVVSTKRGFHCFWHTDDQEPDAVAYTNFIQDYFLEQLNADKNATDAARTFRVPYQWHQKDPNNKFLCQIVVDEPFVYSKKDVMNHIRLNKERLNKIAKRTEYLQHMKNMNDNSFFNNLHNANQKDLLEKISGIPELQRETFTFRHTSGGKFNILVNGKGTACFIDADGKIGARGGDTTIWGWIKWYGFDNKQTYQIIKKYIPELKND